MLSSLEPRQCEECETAHYRSPSQDCAVTQGRDSRLLHTGTFPRHATSTCTFAVPGYHCKFTRGRSVGNSRLRLCSAHAKSALRLRRIKMFVISLLFSPRCFSWAKTCWCGEEGRFFCFQSLCCRGRASSRSQAHKLAQNATPPFISSGPPHSTPKCCNPRLT